MSQTDFWIRFAERTSPYDLLKHPFYQAWSKGELTREDLRSYASEYWHHVSAFPTYLSALHARLPDTELRREVLRNLAEEEATDHPAARPHSDLWMDFAKSFGATRDSVERYPVQPEMQALLGAFRSAMQEPTPAAALAALYAYESKVPEIAATKAQGLVKWYTAGEGATAYFTLHRTADVAHAAVWRELLNQQLLDTQVGDTQVGETQVSEAQVDDTHVGASSRTQEAALASGERAARALWMALDGIERERQARRSQQGR